MYGEFGHVKRFTVVAFRDNQPFVVNHDLLEENVSPILTDLHERQESFLVVEQDRQHSSDVNFVCNECCRIFRDKFEGY